MRELERIIFPSDLPYAGFNPWAKPSISWTSVGRRDDMAYSFVENIALREKNQTYTRAFFIKLMFCWRKTALVDFFSLPKYIGFLKIFIDFRLLLFGLGTDNKNITLCRDILG